MEAGDSLEACSKAGERGKTTIVLFASCENNHVSLILLLAEVVTSLAFASAWKRHK